MDSFRTAVYSAVILTALFNANSQTTDAPQLPGSYPLQGVWYNELGSSMYLNQTDNGSIVGTYSTAVESTAGAAGTTPANLYGHSNVNLTVNPTFGFTVRWPGSTSVFAGQYYYENNEETLLTTWLLVSKVANTGEQWKSTRVGFNRFYRTRQVDIDPIN